VSHDFASRKERQARRVRQSRVVQRTKDLIKTAFPSAVRARQRIAELQHALKVRRSSAQEIFSEIYSSNLWEDPESVSGRGSTLARTHVVRSSLRSLLDRLNARSLFDAPCGDFNWMRYVELGDIEYTGADIVPALIDHNDRLYSTHQRRFVVTDITRDEPPPVDVILCRDCFIHLSFAHIRAALHNFKRSGSRFLLASTYSCVSTNRDTHTGWWRWVNLQLDPFNLPSPLELMIEDAALGKCLGLWRIDDL